MDMDTILLDAEERMEKALGSLDRDFAKLRTGRASTALVDGIKADYYGTMTPIGQMASVAVPDSRTLTIQPWDKGGMAAVEKAILKSDLGLTPINDGKIIRIAIPPLTEERRKELVKVARKYGEEAKVAVRGVRRDCNDTLKKAEKDKEITEDELKKATDDVQKLTDKFEIKGGFMDGKPVDLNTIKSLASIPALPVLQAQVLGTMLAPITGLAVVLKQSAEKQGAPAEAPAEEAAE